MPYKIEWLPAPHLVTVMRIKKLLAEHYKSVKDIFGESFYKVGIDDTDLAYYWRARHSADSLGIFSNEGDLLGFALVIQPAATPNNRYLIYFAVHSAYRGTRLGSTLISKILEKRRAARGAIHLTPLNTAGLRDWYIKRGFRNTCGGYMNFHSYGTRLASAAFKNKKKMRY